MAEQQQSSLHGSTSEYHKATYGVRTRLRSEPSAELKRIYFEQSIANFDKTDFESACLVNVAHVLMLSEQGIVSRDDASQLINALDEIHANGFDSFALDPDLGDPLPNFENFLIQRLGQRIGGKLHTGRSRGDFYVAISRLAFRDRLLKLQREVNRFRGTLLNIADQHIYSIMPGYTHLQHAQPITLAHYLLAFVHQLERDFERLTSAFGRLNASPMGLGIIGASSYPLDRERMRGLLGFDRLIRNGRDLSDRDYAAELAADCSILMMHVHRLSTDLYIWCTSEFSMARLDDGDAITSSIMPQKANPVLLEAALASTAKVHADLQAVLGTLKGSSANNTEAGRADLPALSALEESLTTLRTLDAVIQRITFNTDLMEQRAGQFWAQATDLADALVRNAGISFREAHRIVGRLVAWTLDEGVAPNTVTPSLLAKVSEEVIGQRVDVPRDVIEAAIDPRRGVESRRILGGPASVIVRSEIVRSLENLSRDQDLVTATENALERAERELWSEARNVA